MIDLEFRSQATLLNSLRRWTFRDVGDSVLYHSLPGLASARVQFVGYRDQPIGKFMSDLLRFWLDYAAEFSHNAVSRELGRARFTPQRDKPPAPLRESVIVGGRLLTLRARCEVTSRCSVRYPRLSLTAVGAVGAVG
jgi:hypothetical protein